MGVKFLNQNITVNTTRPTGYKYPTGLTQIITGTANAAPVFSGSNPTASGTAMVYRFTSPGTLTYSGNGCGWRRRWPR